MTISKELIEGKAWVAHRLLTEGEIKALRERAVEAGINDLEPTGDTRYRNSVNVDIVMEEITEAVWSRIRCLVPQEIVVNTHGEPVQGIAHTPENLGRWTPIRLFEEWRVSKYEPGGHLGPHQDGQRVIDDDTRSFVTINGYLTSRPRGCGGATRFLKEDMIMVAASSNPDGILTSRDEDVVCFVEDDEAGKACVFLHDLLHEGEPLKAGSPSKWIFHNEVMYKRDPSSVLLLSDEQLKARGLLGRAEAAEMDGDISAAIRLYNQAYRLDPRLDGN